MSQPHSQPSFHWDHSSKRMEHSINCLEESTGCFGSEESIRCHACNIGVETGLVHFSGYDSEPLCPACAQAEEAGE